MTMGMGTMTRLSFRELVLGVIFLVAVCYACGWWGLNPDGPTVFDYLDKLP
jgi:hypothetical protein